MQASTKSVHSFSRNSDVNSNSCRSRCSAARPAVTSTSRLNGGAGRTNDRSRLYIALLTAGRWLWSIRVKCGVKTKKGSGNPMVEKIWKSAGKILNYNCVNTIVIAALSITHSQILKEPRLLRIYSGVGFYISLWVLGHPQSQSEHPQ